MSMFENGKFAFLMSEYKLPECTRAERYEYCEPLFDGELTVKTAKRRNALSRLMMSVMTMGR